MGKEMEKLAYETHEYREYKLKAFYLEGSDIARIELWKLGELIRSAEVPAYKVWNYSAHFQDIVDSELEPQPTLAREERG